MEPARTAKIRDGTYRDRTLDKTGQSRNGCSKTGKLCSKTENDVLKQERDNKTCRPSLSQDVPRAYIEMDKS